MRFYFNVLRNFRVIGIALNLLGNKFSFKLDLYFMRCMHVITKNETYAFKKKIIFGFLKLKFMTSQSNF